MKIDCAALSNRGDLLTLLWSMAFLIGIVLSAGGYHWWGGFLLGMTFIVGGEVLLVIRKKSKVGK